MPVQILSSSHFKEVVENQPFLTVYFWAEWCVPCVDFSKVFDAVAKQTEELAFATVNIDQVPDIGAYFQVKQVPFLLAIRDKIVLDGQVGAMSKTQFLDLIQTWKQIDHSLFVEHFNEKYAANSTWYW